MSPSVVNTRTQQEPITTTEKDTLSSPPLTSSPEIPRGEMDPGFNVDQNYIDHDSRHQEFDNSDLATPNTDQNHIDHDNIQHYSDFATPNPYACLAEQEQPDVDSISLENIEKAPQTPTLQTTPTRPPKNYEEYMLHCKCVMGEHKTVLCSYCLEFEVYCKCYEGEACLYCKLVSE